MEYIGTSDLGSTMVCGSSGYSCAQAVVLQQADNQQEGHQRAAAGAGSGAQAWEEQALDPQTQRGWVVCEVQGEKKQEVGEEEQEEGEEEQEEGEEEQLGQPQPQQQQQQQPKKRQWKDVEGGEEQSATERAGGR